LPSGVHAGAALNADTASTVGTLSFLRFSPRFSRRFSGGTLAA
jgi:hypothetical protein